MAKEEGRKLEIAILLHRKGEKKKKSHRVYIRSQIE